MQMNVAQKLEIRLKIEEVIQAALFKRDQLRDLTAPIGPENAIGRVSRMDAINNKTINDESLRKTVAKLKGLERALARIEDKDFGYCVRCKNEIPMGRLLLIPHSIFCVHCA